MKIGNKFIGEGFPVYVIAEIGNNHNGSLDRAKKMIDLAHEMGADCAKFQMRHLDQVYRERSLKRVDDDLSTEYTLDLLERFEFSLDEHREVKEYCEKVGIQYLCTPWDVKSVEILNSWGAEGFKVASADLTNIPLVDSICNTGAPMIISTGMSSRKEMEGTVDFLHENDAVFALLHCNSTYPAPFYDINLSYLKELKKLHPIIGYSGHERGIAICLAAVGLGANIIEKHFTLDRNMEGPDHAASLEYSDFKQLIDGIRQIDVALGDGKEKKTSQGEMINRENLAKSLVAAKDLKVGTTLSRSDISVLSPGQGLSPQYIDRLVNRKLKRDMKREDYFYSSDIEENKVVARKYSFKRPWGVPVRYHDFKKYYSNIEPDFVEFHLSYTDMNLTLKDYFDGQYDIDFIVHAPELFEGSRLMDLASKDEEYRESSIKETQRVIDITRQLKRYFPKTLKPLIVANVGGFTMDSTLPPEEVPFYYERFNQSLQQLDRNGVELIPQTMAPFPWHFGGQRHQNMFVLPEVFLGYCEKYNLRMCYDVSHSMLTCNHFGLDFYEFSEMIGPVVAHLHMGDAQGVNGEGLQVGDGEIDFARLGKILNRVAPNAPFLPEIWQGHKNDGEGFWVALERLEGVL